MVLRSLQEKCGALALWTHKINNFLGLRSPTQLVSGRVGSVCDDLHPESTRPTRDTNDTIVDAFLESTISDIVSGV